MEIIEEDDEEVKQLMLRISRKEITLCETCDALFDYVPQKVFCDECLKAKGRERKQRPEVKEQLREYRQRPEVKERRREYMRERYHRLPEEKERLRKYQQRPEVKERRRKQQRERRKRKKKLREEE